MIVANFIEKSIGTGGNYMGVVFTRVDERMIHGQVMSAWAKVLSIDEVILVNDEVVHDDFQKSVMEISVPTGIELRIVSVDDAYEILSHAVLTGVEPWSSLGIFTTRLEWSTRGIRLIP